MSTIDIQQPSGPKRDHLGLSCFAFHIAVGTFVMIGWILTSAEVLLFYLAFLPVMATQWAINKGSCIINNIETWIRTGSWRDSRDGEDGRFVIMLCDWIFAIRPSTASVDRLSYGVVVFLWLLALGHYSMLASS